ncbi:MAG TPA: putative sulfate exporter family transporter [Candidatus Udaeobacter sp.]|nr:putative sulfate exporter family transporter [Candidatus Udaeobacter sp.]
MTGTRPPAVGARLVSLLPGLIAAALLAALAVWLADQPWIKNTTHVSALLIVILLGMAWRSFRAVPAPLEPGVRLAQRPILRWAVAGLGFRLSLAELVKIGAPALAVVVISVTGALLFGWWFARRIGVPEKLGLLLGVGGAICGASAIVAADSVVQGEKRDSALAMGVITLLGTIGIVIYPLLHHPLGLSDFAYGVWDGASLHEMAQVVAAGFGVSEEAARVATVVKLARICLLAPVVLYLGWSLRHQHRAAGKARVSPVPWFLVLFVAFAVLNSSGLITKPALEMAKTADLWLLCVGMAGVGIETSFHDLGRAGFGPVGVGAAQWVVLSALAYGLTRLLCR